MRIVSVNIDDILDFERTDNEEKLALYGVYGPFEKNEYIEYNLNAVTFNRNDPRLNGTVDAADIHIGLGDYCIMFDIFLMPDEQINLEGYTLPNLNGFANSEGEFRSRIVLHKNEILLATAPFECRGRILAGENVGRDFRIVSDNGVMLGELWR